MSTRGVVYDVNVWRMMSMQRVAHDVNAWRMMSMQRMAHGDSSGACGSRCGSHFRHALAAGVVDVVGGPASSCSDDSIKRLGGDH